MVKFDDVNRAGIDAQAAALAKAFIHRYSRHVAPFSSCRARIAPQPPDSAHVENPARTRLLAPLMFPKESARIVAQNKRAAQP